MPNFNKSKGFQLKSGNKAKAPFKMMGSSSPAKGWDDILSTGKKANIEKADQNATVQGVSNKATVGPDGAQVARPEAPEKPKKHRDQVKKAEKITKLEGKEAKRDAKRAEGKKVFLGNLKKKNNANKREKLQTEVDKTSEQYVADKAAKKEAFAQGMRDAGEIVSNIGNTNPKESMSSIIQGQADRKTNKVNKDIQNEKDRVNTARTQQLVDATDKAGTEGEKVSSTKSEAVTNSGNANVTVKTSNNQGSVTTSKNLAKK